MRFNLKLLIQIHQVILFFFVLTQCSFSQCSFSECSSSESLQVASPRSLVQLVSRYRSCSNIDKCEIGILFTLQPGWHIYWRNPGDSGAAPKFSFIDPPLDQPIELNWPIASRIKVSSLVNFGYENSVILSFKVPNESIHGDKISILIHGEWLVCKDDCIPEQGDLKLDLPISQSPANQTNFSKLFEQQKYPVDVKSSNEIFTAVRENKDLKITFKQQIAGQIYVYGEKKGVINPQQVPSQLSEGSGTIITTEVKSFENKNHYLIVTPDQTAYRFKLEDSFEKSNNSLFYYLILAYFGGLILNVMPCVFPVIALKAFSFQTDSFTLSKRLSMALGYCLGIIFTLLSLFLVIFLAKGTAEVVGWGFQLQNPSFVAGLSILFLIIGSSLLGVIQLEKIFALSFSSSTSKSINTFLSHFFSGILTTVVATPCVAPFMAASIAYALNASFIEGLCVFISLGLGLSSPMAFVMISKSAYRILPKPGKWMQTFKEFLAFPMFLTSIWLFSVLSQQVSSISLSYLLLVAVFILMVFWIVQNFFDISKEKKKRFFGKLILIISLIYAYQVLTTNLRSSNSEFESKDLKWEEFSEERLLELKKDHRNIYIDFTAAWCITCQVNKVLVFGSKDVKDILQKRNFALLRADWTNQDPKIFESIQRFGKVGVPVDVVVHENGEENVLPSILTPSMVLNEIIK